MADPGPERPIDKLFPERSIRADKCVQCGKSAKNFRDALSRKEYLISGLCQSCQDKVFGLEDD